MRDLSKAVIRAVSSMGGRDSQWFNILQQVRSLAAYFYACSQAKGGAQTLTVIFPLLAVERGERWEAD